MKEYIREILEKRSNLLKEDYHLFSTKICKKVGELKEYKSAKNLLIFYPYHDEADVLPVAKEALCEGKNVFFPKVKDATTMEFIKIMQLTDFDTGYKGIKEPIGEEVFDKHNICEPTLMILPGSSFDYAGNRTGYGKGYYDRYLEDCYDKITKVGVCFSLQLVEKIPDVKETDIPMDYVICEK